MSKKGPQVSMEPQVLGATRDVSLIRRNLNNVESAQALLASGFDLVFGKCFAEMKDRLDTVAFLSLVGEKLKEARDLDAATRTPVAHRNTLTHEVIPLRADVVNHRISPRSPGSPGCAPA